jgi:glutamate dehydrogenase (NAD(P)+)
VQGWGNVGSAAAYYLAQAGARVVGIIDREGGLLIPDGFSFEQVRTLFLQKKGNKLVAKDMLPFDVIHRAVWCAGAEIFLPCAGSRLVTRQQIEQLVKGGLEVVSSGANVPFADREIFYGPIYEQADSKVAVIPDFIANCGMARAFAFLMQDDVKISDEAIFDDVSATVASALERCHARSGARTGIARTAFENALTELV